VRSGVAGLLHPNAFSGIQQNVCTKEQALLRSAGDEDLRGIAAHRTRDAEIFGDCLAERLHTPSRETNPLIQPLRIRGRIADTQMEGCNTLQHPCMLDGSPHQLQGEPAASSSGQNKHIPQRGLVRGLSS
jgi:hypothetical protein